MSGAVPLLPVCVFMSRTGTNLLLPVVFSTFFFWFLWRHILQFVFKKFCHFVTGFALVFKLMFWLVSKFAVWFILWPTERVIIATPLAAKRHIALLHNDRRWSALCTAHSDDRKKNLYFVICFQSCLWFSN